MFDLDTLTLGETAKVEEIAKTSITSIVADETPKGRAFAALAYVIKRREDSTFSFDQALALTLNEAQTILGITDEDTAVDDASETTDDPKGSAEHATETSLNSSSTSA